MLLSRCYGRKFYTTTGTAGTNPQTALTSTTRIHRITTVNRFSTDGAFIAIKGKAAVTAGKFMLIAWFWDDMNRPADQADKGHLRFVPDAVAVFAVVIEKFLCRFSVGWFHDCFSNFHLFLKCDQLDSSNQQNCRQQVADGGHWQAATAHVGADRSPCDGSQGHPRCI